MTFLAMSANIVFSLVVLVFLIGFIVYVTLDAKRRV